jgi:hypothetical protein
MNLLLKIKECASDLFEIATTLPLRCYTGQSVVQLYRHFINNRKFTTETCDYLPINKHFKMHHVINNP